MMNEVRKVPIDSLRPHPLNEKLYPANEEEDRELEESIGKYGIMDRLVATPEGLIVHGARRWRIAKKLGWKEVECEFRDFDDPELAVIEFNRYRKKTPRIIHNESEFLKKKFAPLAQIRKESTQFAGKDKGGKPVTKAEKFGVPKFEKTETEPKPEPVHVDERIAEKTGVSKGQLHKINYIYRHEDEAKDVVEKLDRGEISVHQAYEKVKKIVEPKPEEEEKEKTWKCDACEHEFSELDPVAPTRYTLCPDCLVEFETWKAEKLYDSN